MLSNGHGLAIPKNVATARATALPVVSNPVYVVRVSMYRPSSSQFVTHYYL